jgi:RimJ/RimL family protein N-acetyltransferase
VSYTADRSQGSGLLVLRPAVFADAELLLAWRNDPLTRAASHSTAAVDCETHRVWLLRLLADPSRRLFIAEEQGVPVGTARADWQDDAWLLSWTTAPEARGRGIAKRMLTLLLCQFAEPVRAEVKAGNAASARIAEHAGMTFERKTDGILYYYRQRKPCR